MVFHAIGSKLWAYASKPVSLAASPDSTDPPPLAAAEFQRTCVPPEEEQLIDTCFGKGDGEATECKNVEEPVRLDAGDFGPW